MHCLFLNDFDQMEKVASFFSFEENAHTERVKTSQFSLWPFLRIYLASQLTFVYDRRVQANTSHFKKLVKYFFRGFNCWFKRFDIIVLSSSDQRKLINGKYTDRIDLLNYDQNKILFLELPSPDHYNAGSTASKNLISRLNLFAIEIIIAKLFSAKKLQGKEIIADAEKLGAHIDADGLSKRFHAQHRVFSWLLSRWKPRLLIVVNSYTNMPYVKAAKDKGIGVVEMQHGVIGEKHYAYQIRFKPDRSYYPDYLLSFGKSEQVIFGGKNNFIAAEKVIPVGSFYIDYISKHLKLYPEIEHFGKFRLRVCISGQIAFEAKMLSFLTALAALCPDVMFAYVPRNINEELEQFSWPRNTVLIRGMNVYECISVCDIHSTINSTCAIESLSLGTPNILMNIENRSKEYFGESLGKQAFTAFADNPKEFANILRNCATPPRAEVRAVNENFIVNNFESRLNEAINSILGKHD